MQHISISKGLNLPLAGEPLQDITEAKKVTRVALLGPDYEGLKPTFLVSVGDHVKKGQVLFTDRSHPGVQFTSPGSGEVESIHRGEKRVFQSLVIRLDAEEESVRFTTYSEQALSGLTRQEVEENLISSGLWSAFRTRPYGKVPRVGSTPRALFVTAMDTNPHAPDASLVIMRRRTDFASGLKVLGRMGIPQIYVCRRPSAEGIPGEDVGISGVEEVTFSGPHPAGLAGTHIHFLCPAGRNRTVWYIGYQDVIALGSLFLRGELDTERIVSISGPRAENPRLLRTRLGASLSELTSGEVKGTDVRIISGSVLSGRRLTEEYGFLGRYHHQISILEEGDKRHFLGWIMPGFTKYAFKWVNISRLFLWKKFKMNTNLHGGHRAIVPIGSYEDVMPLDILPTYLFRSLEVKDMEQSEALGALELEEEDVALSTFVDPGKNDFGVMLREMLSMIEKEG